MSHAYADIAFTPAVRAVQTRLGSRANYASFDLAEDHNDRLGSLEAEFIAARDGFYQATVSETGWPYVQFRGGPAGFLKVLDEKTIGYADFRGNVQYISVGNLQGNDRVSIILMDYANRRRLKILGRARLVDLAEDPARIGQLEVPHYRARVERGVIITVEGYDWNCPQHITPRFTAAELAESVAPLHAELARLQHELSLVTATNTPAVMPQGLGKGPLALRITGVRQLTPRVSAYELSAPDGSELPAIQAGAHIDVPVRLANGALSTRRYSISSDPHRRDAYEVAVLREDAGSGGSAAVHATYQLGLLLHCGLPGNNFNLHDDTGTAVLIAGGIGITPIKAMAQQLRAKGRNFTLHYAVRSRQEAAYLDLLERELGARLHVYIADQKRKLDIATVIANATRDAVFYVCGPERLIDGVRAATKKAGMVPARVRYERFTAATAQTPNQGVMVTLDRSGKRIAVLAEQSILDAVQAAGVEAPAGCRNGSCRSCAVKVLSGEPEHRDNVLSNTERTQAGLMCICVSRARTPELTLDL